MGSWSTGQREFTPLLLGLYDLLPPSRVAKKGEIETVIIEEPEMGLHPRAIYSFMLLALELVARDYRVVISTHSPAVLEVVWAIQEIKKSGKSASHLLEVFGVKKVGEMPRFAKNCLGREFAVHYFEPHSGGSICKEISDLDPGSDSVSVAGWGGLSEFSGNRRGEHRAKETRMVERDVEPTELQQLLSTVSQQQFRIHLDSHSRSQNSKERSAIQTTDRS